MLRGGLVLPHPGSVRLSGHKVMVRTDAEGARAQQVAALSGGGSGHEPAHVGYIGVGMLSAAVVGEVFTSPSSDSVFAAIKAVPGDPGALLVVKNYTGETPPIGIGFRTRPAQLVGVLAMRAWDSGASTLVESEGKGAPKTPRGPL